MPYGAGAANLFFPFCFFSDQLFFGFDGRNQTPPSLILISESALSPHLDPIGFSGQGDLVQGMNNVALGGLRVPWGHVVLRKAGRGLLTDSLPDTKGRDVSVFLDVTWHWPRLFCWHWPHIICKLFNENINQVVFLIAPSLCICRP